MRLEPPLSPCVMVVCAISLLMTCGIFLSLSLGINGNLIMLGIHIITTLLTLMCCTLIANLLTMMYICVPIMISRMSAMLDLAP